MESEIIEALLIIVIIKWKNNTPLSAPCFLSLITDNSTPRARLGAWLRTLHHRFLYRSAIYDCTVLAFLNSRHNCYITFSPSSILERPLFRVVEYHSFLILYILSEPWLLQEWTMECILEFTTVEVVDQDLWLFQVEDGIYFFSDNNYTYLSGTIFHWKYVLPHRLYVKSK